MNGTIFGLWRAGDSSALNAMGAVLAHCGESQHLYDFGASLCVGVRNALARPAPGRVPAVCVGTIRNVPYLSKRFSISAPCPDDELLWQIYCCAGARGLEHVQGAFQLTLYDADERRLILVAGRDSRLPICVGRFPQGLAFAPELKALQLVPSFREEMGRAALTAGLDDEERIPRQAAATTVRFVWPGQVGTFGEEGGRIERMTACESPALVRTSTDALANLRRTIISTTRRLTMSSRATGVLMSPGAGSLICLGAARWVLREQPVRTYVVVYGERDPFRDFARRVARQFGTDHQEIVLTPDTARSLLDELVWETEHPLASECMLDHLLVAQAASGEVDLLLNGDICFASEQRRRRLRVGWPGSRAATMDAADLTPTPASLRDLASIDRVHARAGMATEALFHDSEVRAGCLMAGHRAAACELGAGFVPARLFEEANQHSRRANDAFWREMTRACEDLLAEDSLGTRGMPRLDAVLSSTSPAWACRCLPAPLWSRVMLEMWCRRFVDSMRAVRHRAGELGDEPCAQVSLVS